MQHLRARILTVGITTVPAEPDYHTTEILCTTRKGLNPYTKTSTTMLHAWRRSSWTEKTYLSKDRWRVPGHSIKMHKSYSCLVSWLLRSASVSVTCWNRPSVGGGNAADSEWDMWLRMRPNTPFFFSRISQKNHKRPFGEHCDISRNNVESRERVSSIVLIMVAAI